MRTSIVISVIGLLIVGAGAAWQRTQAMTFDAGTAAQAMRTAPQAISTAPEAMRVADVVEGTEGTDGIQTWTRIMELGGIEDLGKSPQTLFVPSDAAFTSIPVDELKELLASDGRDLRRAFLARGATASRLAPNEIAGRRVSVTTLDGRPLTIDATGEELMVGDAEVLDVRVLPNGKVIYVLDHALTR